MCSKNVTCDEVAFKISFDDSVYPPNSDVTVPGYCSTLCAFHGSYGLDYKFAWTGIPPSGCPCYPQSVSPNGNAAADAAVNMIANVIAKTVTDPFNDAWYYSDNGVFVENADQCSWCFTNANQMCNGAYYNVYIGGSFYYIQSNWNLWTHSCSLY
jgi:Phosphate-induced protein 1 conserved region